MVTTPTMDQTKTMKIYCTITFIDLLDLMKIHSLQANTSITMTMMTKTNGIMSTMSIIYQALMLEPQQLMLTQCKLLQLNIMTMLNSIVQWLSNQVQLSIMFQLSSILQLTNILQLSSTLQSFSQLKLVTQAPTDSQVQLKLFIQAPTDSQVQLLTQVPTDNLVQLLTLVPTDSLHTVIKAHGVSSKEPGVILVNTVSLDHGDRLSQLNMLTQVHRISLPTVIKVHGVSKEPGVILDNKVKVLGASKLPGLNQVHGASKHPGLNMANQLLGANKLLGFSLANQLLGAILGNTFHS